MRHRFGVAPALAVLLWASVPGVAWAHGSEGTDRAYDLVRQAIALIVNTPDDMASITDKVTDAINAPDKSDVQIPLVQQAKVTLDGGDLHQTRALLEKSISARVHTRRCARPRTRAPTPNCAPA